MPKAERSSTGSRRGPRIKPEAILFAFDLLELDGLNLRREPYAYPQKHAASLLKGAPHGIVYNEHIEGDGPTIFPQRLQARLRGDRVQACGLALPIRPVSRLDQDEGAGRDRGSAAAV